MGIAGFLGTCGSSIWNYVAALSLVIASLLTIQGRGTA